MKKEIMKVLNQYAQEKAKQFWYELEKKEIYNPLQDPHPIQRWENQEMEQVRYVQPGEEKEGKWRIETRQRWGAPRIDIYWKNKEWFCSFEFDENSNFSSSQIFYKEWVNNYMELYGELQRRIQKIL